MTAGAAEGAVLAYAQSRVLPHALPGFDTPRWVKATATAGVLGWAAGMTPSTFQAELSRLPVPVLVILGAFGATLLLCSIGGGVAQAVVLRRYIKHGGRWIHRERAGLDRQAACRVRASRSPSSTRPACARHSLWRAGSGWVRRSRR